MVKNILLILKDMMVPETQTDQDKKSIRQRNLKGQHVKFTKNPDLFTTGHFGSYNSVLV